MRMLMKVKNNININAVMILEFAYQAITYYAGKGLQYFCQRQRFPHRPSHWTTKPDPT